MAVPSTLRPLAATPALLVLLVLGGCATEECEWGAETAWDVDADGLLDQNELYSGLDTSGAFTRWDVDADGTLDENEVRTVFSEVGSLGDWDQNDDDLLMRNEVYSGLYSTWNADVDEGISCAEFDREWATRFGVTGG